MATYELDDEDAAYILGQLRARNTPQSMDIVERLEPQIPIPAPVKIGAVVRAGDANHSEVYVRWALDAHTHNPWIEAGNHEYPFRTDEIGRITEVLSPGVDL